MEQLQELYIILIGFFSLTLTLGIVLEISVFGLLKDNKKLLIILGIVNLLSMGELLLKKALGISFSPQLSIINSSVILVLNLVLGMFVYQATSNPNKRFSDGVIRLFILSFLSVVLITILFTSIDGQGNLLNAENNSFIYVFLSLSGLLIYGSVIPGFLSLMQIFKTKTTKNIYYLLVINAINNMVGLYIFTLQFPNRNASVIMNILSNLIFVFLLSYFFLKDYFEVRKKLTSFDEEVPNVKTNFSWNELKNHLSYWEETKDYLKESHSELIHSIDELPLSDLEKMHFLLKSLNIKTKDIAHALNVSVKAVEMNRYRIKKKLEL